MLGPWTPKKIIRRLLSRAARQRTMSSASYWQNRYAAGGNSGAGSYGDAASFKAEYLNAFVSDHNVSSLIEFGCGDGNQLGLGKYPQYIGLDVSQKAISLCKERFLHDRSKSFFLYDTRGFVDNHGLFRAEMALSLDVIFHLVEDDLYEQYLEHLFAAGQRFVAIYSSNQRVQGTSPHVRHRQFADLVGRRFGSWTLISQSNDPQLERDPMRITKGFYVYERATISR